ncbi:hypothetical protein JIG36_26165 [Actinoplanes sp. LDG1-06]|uniref:Uncharacterized protein n=1 Tax=Paractinoplanes ovalisporus TaxID=2810368 RepID=A0ABS2AGU3_9ACTN|nr:hypothetical protein [Actinoplanes ovalisporus]MBM2619047.1 hypothetical protein [Actinoplanes ovalisporus]
MSKRIARATLSVALVAGSTALVLSPAGAAHAIDLVKPLPIASFGDIAVDPANERIFITDPVGGKLVTTDFTGTVKRTEDKMPSISGLVIAKDGDVYAAVPDQKSIVVFNETGTRLDTYQATTAVKPTTLAEAAGSIWFGEADGGLGRLVKGEEPDLIPDIVATPFGSAPVLASAGNLIAATDPSATPGTVTVVNAAGETPAPIVSAGVHTGQVKDLVFNADGSRLLVAGTQNLARAVKPQDLAALQSYTAAADNNAIAVRGDGTVAVGTGNAVSVFAAGSAGASRKFTLKSAGSLQPGGLAWQPGGPRVFGVSGGNGSFDLQIFGDPATLTTKLAVTVPAKLDLGKTAAISAVFTDPIPAGLPVKITRKDAAGSRQVSPSTVPANGTISISDKPTRTGTVTYTVAFAGNDDYVPVTVTKSFTVGTTRATTLTLDRNGSVHSYGATVTLTAKLGATYSNRSVEIWADPFGSDQVDRLVRKAAVNSKGVMTASFKVTRNTTFSAVFRGDLFTTTRTVKSTVSTKASVSTTISKHYKVAKIGSVSYHHVRKTVRPEFTTRIPSYPGRTAYLTLEVFNGKVWKLWQAGYYPLYQGRLVNALNGTHTVGVKYRIRAAYQYGKSGDTLNATNWGTYQYFTFTN